MVENFPSNPLQCHVYQLNDQPWQGPTVARPSQLRETERSGRDPVEPSARSCNRQLGCHGNG